MINRRNMLKTIVGFTAMLSIPSWGAWGRNSGTINSTLTVVEKNNLVFMREEEKLARDVYMVLGEVWGNTIFFNIASSEQRHMDSILNLLNKYKIADPAANKEVGEFTNIELQNLYDSLIEQGNESALAALMVGGIIEETDIEDIKAALLQTKKQDIKNVLTNLLNGSYNHLRSFVSRIEALTGTPYIAQVISQEEVDSVLGR